MPISTVNVQLESALAYGVDQEVHATAGQEAGATDSCGDQPHSGKMLQAAAASAQIHRTFAICLPDCITLLMKPCGHRTLRSQSTAGRGLTV